MRPQLSTRHFDQDGFQSNTPNAENVCNTTVVNCSATAVSIPPRTEVTSLINTLTDEWIICRFS